MKRRIKQTTTTSTVAQFTACQPESASEVTLRKSKRIATFAVTRSYTPFIVMAAIFTNMSNGCGSTTSAFAFANNIIRRSRGTYRYTATTSCTAYTSKNAPSIPSVSAFQLHHQPTAATAVITRNRFFKSSTSTLFSTSSSSTGKDTGKDTGTATTNNATAKANKTPKTPTTTRSYIEPSLSGYKPPSVSWYPGHIAKAERTLSETLTSADVLIEIRDARIPKATSHPRVREWTVGKPRIVVLTRVDTVPKSSVKSWSDALTLFGAGKWDQYIQDGNLRHRARQNMMTRGIGGKNNNNNNADELGLVEDVIFVDAKRGSGLPALLRAIGRAGGYVNEKRISRGLRERPLRLAVLGYPNVG